MKLFIRTGVSVAGGLFLAAVLAWPQTYTISAKPGVVNYIEGSAYLNGNELSQQAVRATFLTTGDKLSTGVGKVEVLLTPGVFLRIGDASEIRMISPAMTDTQFEVVHGEAIIEAAGLLKDNNIRVTDHGVSVAIDKNGLYRFRADDRPSVAVLEGKAQVSLGEQQIELGKDREILIGGPLKPLKFDPKQEDELYAWSNVRSEYDAAATYHAAQLASANNYSGGWGNFGYGGLYGSGWLWNSAFGGYSWLPMSGAFCSPFGWGFYSPGMVGYAPVVTTGVYSGGGWAANPNWNGRRWNGTSTVATVPVALNHPPAVGVIAASPWANQEARVQAAHSLASTGTFNPGTAASSSFAAASHISSPSAVSVRGGGISASAGGWSGGHSGGFSGGAAHAGGGFSGGGFSSAGGGHSGGGGGGGGGGHH